MKRLEQTENDFTNALKALEQAVSEATRDLEIDGAIQRFEFTYELFWKLLRAYLQEQGIIVNTPKECFKEA
jgi:nucleotidyltransferase substrate binding protein (TIGR01987 family)